MNGTDEPYQSALLVRQSTSRMLANVSIESGIPRCKITDAWLRYMMDSGLGKNVIAAMHAAEIQKENNKPRRDPLPMGRPRIYEHRLAPADNNAVYEWDKLVTHAPPSGDPGIVAVHMEFQKTSGDWWNHDNKMAHTMQTLITGRLKNNPLRTHNVQELILINGMKNEIRVKPLKTLDGYFLPFSMTAEKILKALGKTRTAFTLSELALLAEGGFYITYEEDMKIVIDSQQSSAMV